MSEQEYANYLLAVGNPKQARTLSWDQWHDAAASIDRLINDKSWRLFVQQQSRKLVD